MQDAQMRVLHVLPTRAKEYGGPVAVAESLAEEARHMGMKAAFYPALPEEIQAGAAGSLWAAVRQSDVVHIHGLWNAPATMAAMAARHAGIPYVLTPHGMLDRWALNKSRLKKRIYGALFERRNIAGAAAVHFLNHEELDEAQAYGVALKPFVLPNGVFADRYEALPPATALHAAYPQLAGKVLALFLGRLHPKKGFGILLPALAEAVRQAPELHLLIAGPDEGGYKATLHKLIEQHGLQAHVTFFGMVQGQRKLEALAAAHCFVLPSHQEGDSVAVKEAMASGLPVIITPACHFPDVASEQAGLVIEPDVQALKTALLTLYHGEHLRQEMGKRARQLVNGRYTWRAIARRLASEYERVLAASGASRGGRHV